MDGKAPAFACIVQGKFKRRVPFDEFGAGLESASAMNHKQVRPLRPSAVFYACQSFAHLCADALEDGDRPVPGFCQAPGLPYSGVRSLLRRTLSLGFALQQRGHDGAPTGPVHSIVCCMCWFMVPSLVLEVYIGCSVPTLQH